MIGIAPTDNDWFNQLRQRDTVSKINFWTPTPWNIKKLKQGERLYFLLKSPIRKIGGYGFFYEYENITISEAWKKYGVNNGVANLHELMNRTTGYKRKHASTYDKAELNPIIGCIVLEDPVFFKDEDFFDPEEFGHAFPSQVVKLKYFQKDFDFVPINETKEDKPNGFELVNEDKSKYRFSKTKERKGQNQFRKDILSMYKNACAVTGETCIEVLEAAHIQQYINEESNNLSNGICLRSDIHILFDNGLITILPDYTIKVSSILRESSYQLYDMKTISLPETKHYYPSKVALEYHNKYSFRDNIGLE